VSELFNFYDFYLVISNKCDIHTKKITQASLCFIWFWQYSKYAICWY